MVTTDDILTKTTFVIFQRKVLLNLLFDELFIHETDFINWSSPGSKTEQCSRVS